MEPGAMTGGLAQMLRGEGLVTRALRASVITGTGFVVQQAVRLASNLILTRLLFPEAFGMMALITVFLTALIMFSDLGVGPSIMGSARGDDADFLDTAWTIQIGRGVILWIAAVACAWPVSAYYGEPDLVLYLPVAALVLVIAGFNPTRQDSANRHLRAGRLTLIELGGQIAGIVAGIVLAWLLHSVWALVIAGLVGPLVLLAGLNLFLPGPPNRLRWERAAAHELIHFGKWIFLSTFMGFVINQADKVVLGRLLDLGVFGLYNIAWFLASFPLLMGGVVMGRVLIPVYRESPPAESPENFLRLRNMRGAAMAVLLAMVAMLALGGHWLVGILYDDRYAAAGAMTVLVAAVQVPALVIMTCEHAALAAGDSRRFFIYSTIRAATVSGGILAGWALAGLPGAVAGQALGNLLAWPALGWMLHPHHAFDWKLDLAVMAAGAVIGALAVMLNAGPVASLFVYAGA
ncbi:MAG: oligosaccharide flippase family protein [Rubellimicrobium sp.]|nr:oligosaccharide flippase family protein [Rubellimicrobium sp.]